MEHKEEKAVPAKKRKKPMSMFTATLHGLIFVTLWGLATTFYTFGKTYALRAGIIVLVGVVTAYLTQIVYYSIEDVIEKKKYVSFNEQMRSNWKKIKRGVPELTGMIVALCFQIATPFYVIMIAVVLAEVVGKLMWGGFGKNKLNPAAVGFVLTSILFGYYSTMPVVDAVTAATPLSIFASNGWYLTEAYYQTFTYEFGGLISLLIGTVPGPLAEVSRLASILALCYMIWKKAIKWTMPLLYLGTIFISATVVGLIHGFPLSYPFFHLLKGGVIFAAVFMVTDPVTIPKTSSGKAIFAILLGMLTMILRLRFMAFSEGVLFAILIMNLFTTYINDKSSSLNKAPTSKQWTVYGLIGAVSIIVVALLSLTMPY